MSAVVFDPALHGQPLSRPRKRSCAPPEAEELVAEQRDRVSQRRAHRALLHGVGTAWGLVAEATGHAHGGRPTRVIVSPGLAIDAIGREIYVDREQSLEVTSLPHHAIWSELAPPDGLSLAGLRRAYVILRSEPAPTDSPAGSPALQDDTAPGPGGRPIERFRLELAAVLPEGPRALRRECVTMFAAQDTLSPEEARVALWTREGPSAGGVALRADAAPLLLATVDLEVSGRGAGAMAFVALSTILSPNPDNRVRAVLPDAGRVAEVLFGDRLPPRSRR